MKYVVNDRLVLSRPPQGPLASYIVSFAGSLSGRGYGLVSLRNQVLIATGFSNWLEQEGVALCCLSTDHPERYLLHRARHRRPKRGDRAALRHLIKFLHSLNVIPEAAKAECQPSHVEQYVRDYEGYLRDARALSGQTIINYLPFIRQFLRNCFGDAQVSLSRLRAVDVVGFVQQKVQRMNVRNAKNMTTALRSFLFYARYRGDIAYDLAAAVPIVANWSLSSIPRAIAPDQVRRLLADIVEELDVDRAGTTPKV